MEYCWNLWNDAIVENQNGRVVCIYLHQYQIKMIDDLFLDFHFAQDTINTLELINLSIIMFWSFFVIFGICEFGERLSGTFAEINDVYDQFVWYLFPNRAQHMLPILLIVAERPVEVRVFGSNACGRITFKNVGDCFSFFTELQINFVRKLSLILFSYLLRHSIQHIRILWYFSDLEIDNNTSLV